MRRIRQVLWLVLVLVFCAFWTQPAAGKGPSTPEERAIVLQRIRMLERDPLNPNADSARAELKAWAIELPEIRFHRCSQLLGSSLDSYPYARQFNDQIALSGVAYTLERQDKMRDAVATYIAGVEGSLRMYEVLRDSKPDGRFPFLDDLIAVRDRGELARHISSLASERCPTSNAQLFNVAGATIFDLVIGAFIGWLFGRNRRRQDTGDVPADDIRTTRAATVAGWVVFACAAYYVTVIATLHFLEPSYDPRYRFVSEYQWSGHAWLMYTTFFVLALATLTMALVMRRVHRSSRSARIGLGLLILGAVGIAIAGIFRGFPLHDVGSAIGLPSLLLAVLFYSWNFRRVADWAPVLLPSVLIGLAMSAVFVSLAAGVGWPGLQQRAFLGLFLLWLMIVAYRATRR